jgi:HlyD family secretion protein
VHVKKPILILGILVGVLVLGAVGYRLLLENQGSSKNSLRLMGHIEATETNLGFKVPGKISAIRFEEGQVIKAGEIAAELEAEDLRQEVAAAAARVEAAQANLTKLEAGFRPQEVREAQAAVGQARADYEDKKKDYGRMQNLFQRRVVSGSTRDRAEAAYLMAKEALRRAEEQSDLRRSGYRKEDIDSGRADLSQAKANLELAKTRLGYAVIRSPVQGVVLSRPVEPGQVAAVGATVLVLGDLDNAYFEGWIPETDLARVRYNQKATVTTDTYPGKRYPGWVSYIASKAEFTPKTVETYKERVTLVYRTKIRVDNPNYELKPGMPAEAVISFGGEFGEK